MIILSEASTAADGALSRERSGFLPVWVCNIRVKSEITKGASRFLPPVSALQSKAMLVTGLVNRYGYILDR